MLFLHDFRSSIEQKRRYFENKNTYYISIQWKSMITKTFGYHNFSKYLILWSYRFGNHDRNVIFGQTIPLMVLDDEMRGNSKLCSPWLLLRLYYIIVSQLEIRAENVSEVQLTQHCGCDWPLSALALLLNSMFQLWAPGTGLSRCSSSSSSSM